MEKKQKRTWKFSAKFKEKIRRLHKEGMSTADIGRTVGISYWSVDYIVNPERQKSNVLRSYKIYRSARIKKMLEYAKRRK